ncbi:helix-hairpin-helix domain-containing protein [Desulfobacula sp.]|uniref:ComEA family DNA-binding protein n=1 Tax=Desulfobacula sp. TaxID=2593537 RepID=UPI002602AA27|nr:helix-hairpin-helix domain-containing protein [Desulfobacula sp.]
MKKIKKVFILILTSLLFVCFCQPVLATTGKININVAPKNELVSLKYVGDKIADRIIEYRKAHPFENPQEIMKVKGVGQKVFDANKNLIIVKEK